MSANVSTVVFDHYDCYVMLSATCQRQLSFLLIEVNCQLTFMSIMTLNDPTPSFKVTPFFDAEYLINGTRYIVSMKY